MTRRKRTNRNIPAKGRLREMADRLWSIAVREDWNYWVPPTTSCCAVCGSASTESHHLIPRQWYATRYMLENGVALCARCHKFNADVSPHQNAAGWLMWLQEHHPQRAEWYMHTMETGGYKELVVKNADFFCARIRELRQYVNESDFERIVGVRFAAWLEDDK